MYMEKIKGLHCSVFITRTHQKEQFSLVRLSREYLPALVELKTLIKNDLTPTELISVSGPLATNSKLNQLKNAFWNLVSVVNSVVFQPDPSTVV